MKVILCLAVLLGVAQAGFVGPSHGHYGGYYGPQRVFGFPGSDPRCHENGDIVMDPVNRCQVFQCVMKEKNHGYGDKRVYKYFDVEAVACPSVKVPAYIQHPHHGHHHAAPHTAPHAAGYHGHGHGYGYGYKTHEIDIQSAVNKYTHAHYLATHIKGEVKDVCGDYAYNIESDCTDVQTH